jgi:hypothetical protein
MYSEINLDLQAFAKRVYDSYLYQSTFYNFLNPNYIGTIRQTGAPVIEIAKQNPVTAHVRSTKEIQTALDPQLTTYSHTMVDLTELNLDYAIRVPMMVTGSDITNAIQEAADLQDAANAEAIDVYGYNKLAAANIDEVEWNPSTKEEYIELLNSLKAKLFNKKVTGEYRLGLGATEYAKLVSALTTILKFETPEGVRGVTMGEVASIYGIGYVFEINDNVLNGEVGYFFNPMSVVGDTFISAMVQTSSDIRYPGYFCLSGTQSFGAEVVRPEGIVRLVSEISA